MRKLYIPLALFFTVFLQSESKGQTGVGTNNPAASSNMEVSATNKGLLLPRMSVTNVTSRNPIATTPAEGLLIFNNNASTKKTWFHWDPALNSGNGAWNTHLLFKETPKTAVLGISGPNIPALDDLDGGGRTIIGGVGNSHTIISSGYLPNLSVSVSSGATLLTSMGAGTYMLEVSFLITAPPPDAGRGTPLQGLYYNMGYFFDFYLFNNGVQTHFLRTERAALSQTNQPHRVSFNITFTTSGTNPISTMRGYLGRRSGSSHNDLVNVVNSGTYYKLTKLN